MLYFYNFIQQKSVFFHEKQQKNHQNLMKTTEKSPKNAKFDAIWYAFNTLRVQNIVNSQKDFAKLLGINEQSISSALRGVDAYLTDSLLFKVDAFMKEQYGINIYDQQGTLNMAGGSTMVVEGDQKILGNENDSERWFSLVDEKDKQIDRLLSLLEREQASREELIKKIK